MHPDPVAVSSTFLAPPKAGEVEVEVTTLSAGKSVTSALATMTQGGKPMVMSMVTLADLSTNTERAPGAPEGTNYTPFPDVPTPEECRPMQPDRRNSPLDGVLEFLTVPGFEDWVEKKWSPDPRILMWARFRDGRPADTLCLPGLSDMGPPPSLRQGRMGWIPTLQLHVGTFARPTGSWILMDMFGSPYTGKYVCEDVDMWDESGVLVARARQEAVAPRPQTRSPLADTKSGH
ncbi:acyl-CoA thioesterase [Antricoccus suffuscus]|uniref:Acyl-CoA thioesterase n=1 Tax=Antricoccus suffuscus TaxID=1629062 RepID=A0A2T0ZXS1_9ACTN|nr:acyl-CoA thioesterase [Antricoccus suffuscus]